MKTIKLVAVALLLSIASMAAPLPDAPQPATDSGYGSGFGTDNQFYTLQGWGVASIVGGATKRPWLGMASGVGSCALYRAIHDQGYQHDSLFSSNRMAFCAVGSAAGYGMLKLMHVHRKQQLPPPNAVKY